MKKNMLLLSLFMMSGAVGQLKARAMINPYWQADQILVNVVGWGKLNEAIKNPSKYLTAKQFETYNAEVGKVKAELAAQETWYQTEMAGNHIASFPDYSKRCNLLEKEFSFLKGDESWQQIRKFLDDHAGKPYSKMYQDQRMITNLFDAIWKTHRVAEIKTKSKDLGLFAQQLCQNDLNAYIPDYSK